MHYRQINKKTGIEYGIVNEAAKIAFESVPSTNVFDFIAVPEPVAATPPEGLKPAKSSKPPKRRKRKTNTVQDDKSNG